MHMQSLGSTRKADFPLIEVDFTKATSVEQAMWRFRETHGLHIASFIHLVAFFDLSGEENPRYQSVNVEGTRRPMYALYLGAAMAQIYKRDFQSRAYSGSTLVSKSMVYRDDMTDTIRPGNRRFRVPNQRRVLSSKADRRLGSGETLIPVAQTLSYVLDNVFSCGHPDPS